MRPTLIRAKLSSLRSVVSRFINNDKGVTLITVVALLLMMVVAFAALFGSSYLSAGKAQITNIANVTALAAVKGYVEAKPTPGENEYYVRGEEAKRRANVIAGQNKIKGVSGALGNIDYFPNPVAWPPSSSVGSGMEFGQWWVTPNPTRDPCHGNYPCFEPKAAPSPNATGIVVNAAGVQVCTDNETSPLMIPFVGAQKTCSSSIATLMQRCVVFLLDASISTTLESHYPVTNITLASVDIGGGVVVPRIAYPNVLGLSQAASAAGYNEDTNPGLASLAFYRADSIEDSGSLINCDDPVTFTGVNGVGVDGAVLRERLHWCTMGPYRTHPVDPEASGDDAATFQLQDARLHYRSDYVKRDIPALDSKPGFSVYVDSYKGGDYVGPQPLGTILLAINAATRSMLQWQTGGDRAALIAFRGDIVSRVPQVGMSTDLGYLVQLTNFDNRGIVDETGAPVDGLGPHHPNFLDKRWFPLLTDNKYDSSTNIVGALENGMNTLKTYCPKNAEKSIILFSDGIPSCMRTTINSNGEGVYDCPSKNTTLETRFSMYGSATASLVGRGEGGSTKQLDSDWQGQPSMRVLLKSEGIKVTIIQSGDHAGPNTVNRLVNGKYLTHDEARSLGYSPSGNFAGDINKWYSTYYTYYPGMYWWDPKYPNPAAGTNYDPASFACLHIGEPDYVCGGTNPSLAELAMETNGYYCPLRPKCTRGTVPAGVVCPGNYACKANSPNHPDSCNPSCYESTGTPPRLKDNVRIQDWALTCAEYDQTKSEQAAACAVQTVGANPYILVEPEPAS